MKVLLMACLASMIGLTAAQAQTSNRLHNIPVTDASGYLTNGNLDVKHFVARNGQIWAVGLLTGTVSGRDITHGVQMPVTVSAGSSGIASIALKSRVGGPNNEANATKPVDCTLVDLAFGA